MAARTSEIGRPAMLATRRPMSASYGWQGIDDEEPVAERPESERQARHRIAPRAPHEEAGVAVATLGADHGRDPGHADHQLIVGGRGDRGLERIDGRLHRCLRCPVVEVGMDGRHRGQQRGEVAGPARDPGGGRVEGHGRGGARQGGATGSRARPGVPGSRCRGLATTSRHEPHERDKAGEAPSQPARATSETSARSLSHRRRRILRLRSICPSRAWAGPGRLARPAYASGAVQRAATSCSD